MKDLQGDSEKNRRALTTPVCIVVEDTTVQAARVKCSTAVMHLSLKSVTKTMFPIRFQSVVTPTFSPV